MVPFFFIFTFQQRARIHFSLANFLYQLTKCATVPNKVIILHMGLFLQEERQMREKFLREAQYSRGKSVWLSCNTIK